MLAGYLLIINSSDFKSTDHFIAVDVRNVKKIIYLDCDEKFFAKMLQSLWLVKL